MKFWKAGASKIIYLKNYKFINSVKVIHRNHSLRNCRRSAFMADTPLSTIRLRLSFYIEMKYRVQKLKYVWILSQLRWREYTPHLSYLRWQILFWKPVKLTCSCVFIDIITAVFQDEYALILTLFIVYVKSYLIWFLIYIREIVPSMWKKSLNPSYSNNQAWIDIIALRKTWGPTVSKFMQNGNGCYNLALSFPGFSHLFQSSFWTYSYGGKTS